MQHIILPLWLDQERSTCLAELIFIAIGHVTLGIIIGLAL